MAIDVASRTICAAVLRPVAAKAVDAALLLARMLVPEPLRPGWADALAMAHSRLPHARLLSLDARLAQAAAKPVIIPDTIVVDHGKVFCSEAFLRACALLGISVQPAHQRTPTDKVLVAHCTS
jgi:transposase InsO family protein